MSRTEMVRGYRAKWKRNNPEKNRAHNKIYRARKSGKLPPLSTCSRCPDPATQSHHEDHARQLDVEELCSRCHGETRRK